MNAAAGGLGALLALASVLAVRAAGRSRDRMVAHGRLARLGGHEEGPSRAATSTATPPEWFVRQLTRAGVEHEPRWLWLAWISAAAVSVGGATVVGGPGLAMVAAVALGVTPPAVLASASGRADRMLEEALPGALEAVARGLRSGASLVQAIGEAAAVTPGRLGRELGAVPTAVARGASLTVAIDAWGATHALAGVRLAVSALALGAETGGGHARALEGVAASIRSRLTVSREIRALSSQARLSGVVISLAPLGFAVVAAAADQRTATFLLRTPLGLLCLAAGLVLDGAAALWMHRLAEVEA